MRVVSWCLVVSKFRISSAITAVLRVQSVTTAVAEIVVWLITAFKKRNSSTLKTEAAHSSETSVKKIIVHIVITQKTITLQSYVLLQLTPSEINLSFILHENSVPHSKQS